MSATVIVLAERRSTESDLQLNADQAHLARLFYVPAFMTLPFLTLRNGKVDLATRRLTGMMFRPMTDMRTTCAVVPMPKWLWLRLTPTSAAFPAVFN
jgi:hypothetical protein